MNKKQNTKKKTKKNSVNFTKQQIKKISDILNLLPLDIREFVRKEVGFTKLHKELACCTCLRNKPNLSNLILLNEDLFSLHPKTLEFVLYHEIAHAINENYSEAECNRLANEWLTEELIDKKWRKIK